MRATQAPRTSRGNGTERNRRPGPQCAKPTPDGALGEVESDRIGTIRAITRRLGTGKMSRSRRKLRSSKAETLLEEALFVFFRAGHAMARPRNGFQALLLKFLFALDARAVCIRLDAFQRFVDQRQHGPVGVGLPEQEFLGVGIRSLVRKIHCRVVIRGPAFFLSPGNGLDQFLAPSLQLFFVII